MSECQVFRLIGILLNTAALIGWFVTLTWLRRANRALREQNDRAIRQHDDVDWSR